MLFRRNISTDKQPRYGIISGASGMPKQLGISGDSYMCRRLSGNRYIIALADGMGTGQEASECSRFVLDSLYQLLRVGLDYETIIGSLNAAVPMNINSESFSTLDMAIFNLDEGICHLYKAGAAPTIIQRGEETGIIRLPSLPIGILDKPDFKKLSFEIERGDRLFFMSDGVSEAAPPDDNLAWARTLITDYPNEKPRSMSERLIWGSTIRYGQNERDDMTVISAEII